jgi:uncharacterized membrane protein
MGIAINVKMSALLYLPGYLLTIAFQNGIIKTMASFVLIFALQIIIGLEFILVNSKAYFSMSYNFDR